MKIVWSSYKKGDLTSNTEQSSSTKRSRSFVFGDMFLDFQEFFSTEWKIGDVIRLKAFSSIDMKNQQED